MRIAFQVSLVFVAYASHALAISLKASAEEQSYGQDLEATQLSQKGKNKHKNDVIGSDKAAMDLIKKLKAA